MSTRDLAKWVSSISYADLPAPVVAKAKDVIFDCLGACIFTGARTKWGKVITEFATVNGGGQPESTIISTNRKSLAVQAALANGTLAEGFELGDFDPDTGTRPQPMVIPTILAVGELRKIPGKRIIEGVIAAYETNFRIGRAMNPNIRGRVFQQRGFYAGSNIGTFAAAAGAAKTLGLDADKMTMTLGIAGALTGGWFQGHEEGAWTRRLNAGMTTERGVTAALLAESGFIGPTRPLEGENGFYKTVADNQVDLSVLSNNPGDPYMILSTWLKAYPMNGTLHSPVEGLLKLMKANNVRSSDIDKIVSTWFRYMGFIGKKEVKAIVSAQASLPYALAASAVNGKCTVDEFSDQTLNDPAVKAMLDRIEVSDDPTLYEKAGRKSVPGRVTVTTKDGRILTEEVTYPKGNSQNPMSSEELRRKFATLSDGVLEQSARDRIYDMVMNIEKITDLSEILQLCACSKAPEGRTWNS